jgi:hypothetical protein
MLAAFCMFGTPDCITHLLVLGIAEMPIYSNEYFLFSTAYDHSTHSFDARALTLIHTLSGVIT